MDVVDNALYRDCSFVFHLIIGTATSAGTFAPVLQNISRAQIKRTSAQNLPRSAIWDSGHIAKRLVPVKQQQFVLPVAVQITKRVVFYPSGFGLQSQKDIPG